MKGQNKKNRLNLLLKSTPAVIYTCKTSGDYAATYISENVLSEYGYTQKEFLSNPKFWIKRVHPEDRERILKGLSGVLKRRSHSHQYRFLHKNGSYVWVSDELRVLYGSRGKPEELIGHMMDITNQKLSEEEIKKSEERYKTIFEHSPVSMWEEDFSDVKNYLDGLKRKGVYDFRKYFNNHPEEIKKIAALVKVININSATFKMYKAKGKEDLLQGLPRVFTEKSYEVFKEEIISLAEGKTVFMSGPAETRTFTGEKIMVVLRLVALPGHENDLSKVVAAISDVTDLKKAEEVLKRDKETLEKIVNERTKELISVQKKLADTKRLLDIGTLAATVAHELRNPLGVIRTAVYNINRKNKDSSLNSHLANIEKKIKESDRIITNLLSYSKVKIPNLEKIKIADLLKECMLNCKEKYPSPDIVYNFKSKKRDYVIEADRFQIEELFNNILDNAVQAFSDKRGVVNIVLDCNKNEYRIIIKDNGIGIDRKDKENIFEPFFTTRTKGIGLGLAVCKQVVDMHKGAIEIQSEKHKGTTVTVALPQRQNAEL